jgi:hypothetical protein
MIVAALSAFTLVLPACEGDDAALEATTQTAGTITAPTATSSPTTTEAETESETELVETEDADATGSYPGLYGNTYRVSREVCKLFGVVAVARQYGSARELHAAARAFSMGWIEGLHRQAAYAGCVEGFRSRENVLVPEEDF